MTVSSTRERRCLGVVAGKAVQAGLGNASGTSTSPPTMSTNAYVLFIYPTFLTAYRYASVSLYISTLRYGTGFFSQLPWSWYVSGWTLVDTTLTTKPF